MVHPNKRKYKQLQTSVYKRQKRNVIPDMLIVDLNVPNATDGL